MSARGYRYFAAATVALAVVVALFADFGTPPADPAPAPTIGATSASDAEDATQAGTSPSPEPPEVITESGFDAEFGEPMMWPEDIEEGPLAPFGEPQMATEPQAF